MALRLPAGTEVAVRGYVVGYVAGTSLSAAFFGAPEDKQNTNMLLACRANEAYSEDCLPVRLVTTGANPRAALNMYDHPEYFGREIVVCGVLETYFKVNGLLSFRYFWTGNRGRTDWFDDDDGSVDTGFASGGLPGIISGPAVMEGR